MQPVRLEYLQVLEVGAGDKNTVEVEGIWLLNYHVLAIFVDLFVWHRNREVWERECVPEQVEYDQVEGNLDF